MPGLVGMRINNVNVTMAFQCFDLHIFFLQADEGSSKPMSQLNMDLLTPNADCFSLKAYYRM